MLGVQKQQVVEPTWDIVDLRCVFTLRRVDALHSLIALVVGITMISFSTVHTSEIATRCAGESATIDALTLESVGFSFGDLELKSVN